MPELAELLQGSQLDSVHPWQEPGLRQLLDLHKRDRLPHGLLLLGRQAAGIDAFAWVLARHLLCRGAREGTREEEDAIRPCGSCSGCHLTAAGNHPDLIWVYPKESSRIRVGDIRLLLERLAESAQQGGARVAIITPAEQLNINASNALLKRLEEPGRDTWLLLTAASESRLLPTIRSRCQRFAPGTPDAASAEAWLRQNAKDSSPEDLALALRLADGNPPAALACLQNDLPVRRRQLLQDLLQLARGSVGGEALAKHYAELPPRLLLDLLQRSLQQVIRDQCTGRDETGLAAHLSVDGSFQMLRRLTRLSGDLAELGQIPFLLCLESFFLELGSLLQGRRESMQLI